MRRYELSIFVFFLALLFSSCLVNAQYWYQYGVRAGVASNQNNGAAITIQTITPQMSKSGSFGYWVGENLDNGAFLQVGYVIENVTGQYPAFCDLAGCRNYQLLNAGNAQWFYEYFPSGFNGGFLGALGPDGSAGQNGTFHRYSFYAQNNKWYFTFDGTVIGNVSLGSTYSGASMPVAFGEVANTSGVGSYVPPIIFSNFSAYKSGRFIPVQQGLSYIGYGVGSKTDKLNPYGLQELNNRINYFQIGSNLPQPKNNTVLWSLGYTLKVNSAYANISSATSYVAYSNVKISSPATVLLNATTRMVFSGWVGTGQGSYSGPANNVFVTLNGNVTETATWQKQYYLNISSAYGTTYGSGWYYNNTAVSYGVYANTVQSSASSRQMFGGWSNANKAINGTIVLTKPSAISASWNQQYLVSVQSQYGNVSGGGWYNNNTLATISINSKPVVINSSAKLGFYQWSNANQNATMNIIVNSPAIFTAQFKYLYLTSFIPKSASGSQLANVTLYVGNSMITNSTYFFGGIPYFIPYAYYKGVKMDVNANFTVNSSGTVKVVLPVYNVNIASKDIFGLPVNSSITLKFSNSSQVSTYTGANGVASFSNVPYGYASGSATYLGITQQLNARQGSNPSVLFFSIFDIELVGAVILIIIIAFFMARHHFGKVQYQV